MSEITANEKMMAIRELDSYVTEEWNLIGNGMFDTIQTLHRMIAKNAARRTEIESKYQILCTSSTDEFKAAYLAAIAKEEEEDREAFDAHRDLAALRTRTGNLLLNWKSGGEFAAIRRGSAFALLERGARGFEALRKSDDGEATDWATKHQQVLQETEIEAAELELKGQHLALELRKIEPLVTRLTKALETLAPEIDVSAELANIYGEPEADEMEIIAVDLGESEGDSVGTVAVLVEGEGGDAGADDEIV
jgi:hypothetical protein